MGTLESKDVSPKIVPFANTNSLVSGQAPGGVIMGSSKRKLTADGHEQKVDIKNLAQDLNNLCAKEYNRRLSGNAFKDVLEQHETEASKKTPDNAGYFLKSP